MTITDQAGRKVTIPKTINKVYGMSPVATDYVYMLAPENSSVGATPLRRRMKFIAPVSEPAQSGRLVRQEQHRQHRSYHQGHARPHPD